ncbi:MAG: 30S ribosomal protein S20 [Microgenomates group bacterium]
MPVTKSAKKALRKDRRRTVINKLRKKITKEAIKIFKKSLEEKDFKKAVSLIDRLAKTKVIHKNKAARLKSKLARLLAAKTRQKTQKLPTKSVPKSKKRISKSV